MRQRQRERQTERQRDRYTATDTQRQRDRGQRERQRQRNTQKETRLVLPLFVVFQAFFQNDIVWMTCSGPLHKHANFMAITAMAESYFLRKEVFLLISVQR